MMLMNLLTNGHYLQYLDNLLHAITRMIMKTPCNLICRIVVSPLAMGVYYLTSGEFPRGLRTGILSCGVHRDQWKSLVTPSVNWWLRPPRIRISSDTVYPRWTLLGLGYIVPSSVIKHGWKIHYLVTGDFPGRSHCRWFSWWVSKMLLATRFACQCSSTSI